MTNYNISYVRTVSCLISPPSLPLGSRTQITIQITSPLFSRPTTKEIIERPTSCCMNQRHQNRLICTCLCSSLPYSCTTNLADRLSSAKKPTFITLNSTRGPLDARHTVLSAKPSVCPQGPNELCARTRPRDHSITPRTSLVPINRAYQASATERRMLITPSLSHIYRFFSRQWKKRGTSSSRVYTWQSVPRPRTPS
jgi:hypothetical protein